MYSSSLFKANTVSLNQYLDPLVTWFENHLAMKSLHEAEFNTCPEVLLVLVFTAFHD